MQGIRVNDEEFKRKRKHEELKQRLTNALEHYCIPLIIEDFFLPTYLQKGKYQELRIINSNRVTSFPRIESQRT